MTYGAFVGLVILLASFAAAAAAIYNGHDQRHGDRNGDQSRQKRYHPRLVRAGGLPRYHCLVRIHQSQRRHEKYVVNDRENSRTQRFHARPNEASGLVMLACLLGRLWAHYG